MCKDTKLIGKKARYSPKSLQSWQTLFVIEFVILVFGIKAGAGLVDVGKVAVTEDDGMGIAFLEVLEHKQQGSFLCRSTGVGWLTLFIDATLVADADAAVVIPYDMGTSLTL